ncbi:protein PAXX isoform X1 [Pseudophryne corroboree]|uniref:protein PAXX isoform X1 n=1 Tax=Pseudophryne corroboree TaxID=495146 RepID=UPI0030820774
MVSCHRNSSTEHTMEAAEGWSPVSAILHAGQRYLCLTRLPAAGGGVQLHITNGNEVWRTDPIEEALEEWSSQPLVSAGWRLCRLFRLMFLLSGCRSQDDLTGAGEQTAVRTLFLHRETFQNRAPVLEMQGSLASLSIPSDSGNVALDLTKLPVSEARAHVQEALFDLADRVRGLENRLKAAEGSVSASVSPVKQSERNHLVHIPDVDARMKGYGGSVSQAKKRVPGESLINPGCKSKKAAKGVDFEES